MKFVRSIMLMLAAAVATTSHGSDNAEWSLRDQISVRLSVGTGEMETPIILHEDRRFHWLPQLSWYGERLYFENGLLGYALSEKKQTQWDVVAYINDDGLLYHYSNDLVPSIIAVPRPYPGTPDYVAVVERPERHLSTMFGLRFAQQYDSFDLSVQAAGDVSDVHHGWEVLLRFNKPLWTTSENWRFDSDVGLSLKSGSLVDYYYTPQRGELYPYEGEAWLDCNANHTQCTERINGPYRAQAGWRLNLGGRLSYTINDNWAVVAQFRRYWLSHEMTASPLVTRDHYDMWFAGLMFGIN